jgi:hypothetical protein
MVGFMHLPDKSAGDFVSIGRTCVIGSIAVSTALGKKRGSCLRLSGPHDAKEVTCVARVTVMRCRCALIGKASPPFGRSGLTLYFD